MKEKKMITKIKLQTDKLVCNQHIFFFLGEIKKPHVQKRIIIQKKFICITVKGHEY